MDCSTTWPPGPSPIPGVYSNSCPLSRWCHPTVSSSFAPFSSCLQSFPASGSFKIGRASCRERVKVGGKGDNRGWDGWTASLTQWTWVWVNSGSWWWIGRPGVLWFMGSQRVGHDWATELNCIELNRLHHWLFFILNLVQVTKVASVSWLDITWQSLY